MALDNIIFGILGIIAIMSMIMLGILSYVLWKVGDYKKGVLCAIIVVLLFLFFFGEVIGLPRCFGYC